MLIERYNNDFIMMMTKMIMILKREEYRLRSSNKDYRVNRLCSVRVKNQPFIRLVYLVSFMLNIKVPPKHCSDICGDNAGTVLKDFYVQNALYTYLQLSFPLSQTVHKQGKNGLHSF